MSKKKVIYSLIATFLLNSCISQLQQTNNSLNNKNIKILSSYIKEKKNKKTINFFSTLKNEFTLSQSYKKILILKIEAEYNNQLYDSVLLSTNEFIYKFPIDKNIDFVYYSKASATLEKYLDSKKDIENIKIAINQFKNFIRIYSKNKYINIIKIKLEYANNIIDSKNISIGRFFCNIENLISAIIYFINIVDRCNSSLFLPEAYFMISYIYGLLDLNNLSNKYIQQLKFNYPASQWSKKIEKLVY